ncbi:MULTISPECIES: hypothetical protein [unclassified Acinetobacter]|uniref:hypothetical protein n=1 Tax=unclassified Acinetobacter TaxID=196816 RepID=UPI0035BA88FD
MPSHFGFIPSNDLQQQMQQIKQQRHGKEPIYPLRDKIAVQLNDELLDRVLGDLIQQLPASDKRDTAEKLMTYVKSSIHVLLNQLLGKASNDELQASIDFIDQSFFKDAKGQQRLGAVVDNELAKQLQSNFTAIQAGEPVKAIRPALTQQYQNLADQIIHHFMTEFQKTLGLGMIKRKAADIATAAVKKAVHIGIEKLVPMLDSNELKVAAEQHSDLIHI